ncbi:MAG: homogentisate 1,2-dioxygenase [Myxococcales bacterium]|nr:homogentisate 1,2-dioxygenase [Myxococcales bacterium]
MSRSFTIERGKTRVVFGAGSSERIASDIAALGAERVLVVSTAGRNAAAELLSGRLGACSVGVLNIAREHVPVEVVAEARRELLRVGADSVLALGGGSAIGLAKALALDGGVRVIALPTTYSGSEMTPIYGMTEGGQKKTGRDERVRPALVVYDPNLTAALPRAITMTSLWNALAHAVEALWSSTLDRATALAAEEAVRLLASSLSRLTARPDDAEAREAALEGAYLAGLSLADAGAGLHHKLCHVLGGMFALPHAATHAVLLPHVVGFQRATEPQAMAALGRALLVVDPVEALARLARVTGVPRSLRELGMPEEGIARAVDAVVTAPSTGSLERAALTQMLTEAWSGPSAHPAPPPLRRPSDAGTQPGLGSTHESEALPGALPRRQNIPRRAPYGLFPELFNGTPFTVKNADNSRLWMYRVRPSFAHGEFTSLPSARFTAPLGDACPTRMRWRPMASPDETSTTDFLDGLVTLGGGGDLVAGPGWAVHLYAANADMADRAFADADGDLLIVPQQGTLDCRTELGWLRVAPGSVLLIPRAIKFAIGLPDGAARGWVLEVVGRRFRLPERGPIGSNGLADARHFLAPQASFEDRLCRGGFQIVNKLGGRLAAAMQEHSPFDVVAWHGNHVPCTYDLSLFNAMGTVTFDHPDPSILTVLTAPLDDHGRAIADFVVFPPRWEVAEHSFRPPVMHRNAASEVNMVVSVASVDAGYEPGCTFLSPLLTAHGVTTKAYDHHLGPEFEDVPKRIPDESLWVMFESALPMQLTAWARETPLVDAGFLQLFDGLSSRFDPSKP